MGCIICHSYSLKEYIKVRFFIQEARGENTGEYLATHWQPLDLHDLEGVGGGEGCGVEAIIEGQFSPGE